VEAREDLLAQVVVAEFVTSLHELSEDLWPGTKKRTLFTSSTSLKNIGMTFFRGAQRVRVRIRKRGPQRLKPRWNCSSYGMAEQLAETVAWFVIPSEARNLSSAETQEKRDSSLRRLRSE
jgi:hypothetical protein